MIGDRVSSENFRGEVNIFMFRAGAKESSPPPAERFNAVLRQDRAWTPADGASLSEEGRRQIDNIRDQWLLPNGPFDIVFCGKEISTIQSALQAFRQHELVISGEITPEFEQKLPTSEYYTIKHWTKLNLKEGRKMIIVSDLWNEVNLGDLEKEKINTPNLIKARFAEYNPGVAVPEDANDCLYESWPTPEGWKPITFEPYSEFRARMERNFSDVNEHFKGEQIACVANCENWRDALMMSIPQWEFYETEFGKKIKALFRDFENESLQPLGKTITRSQFKPCYGGGLQLKITANKIQAVGCFGEMDKPKD